MAGKITIRRAGGLLPALSLVVFVLLASLFTWLSTAGLPGFALRKIEAEAARHGIHLHVGKLKLSPASGLAIRARNVTLYAAEGDSQPLATLERATLAISPAALLRGHLRPSMAEFRNLDACLPTDGEVPLTIRNATASANIRKGGLVRLTSAAATVEGIPVKLRGTFKLPKAEEETTPRGRERLSPGAHLVGFLNDWKEDVGVIQRSLAAQKWTDDSRPYIDLGLVMVGDRQRLSARLSVPRYDVGQFHFRNASIDIAYHDHMLVINKAEFTTENPDSEVSLQGGYDLRARHLSINLKSTAALTRMAEAISLHGVDMTAANEWLSRFRHSDATPPDITLRGDMYFEEDFSPKSIDVQGQIVQKDCRFGQTDIKELFLPFYYKDGAFNINGLKLTFPTGSLTLTASASSDTLKGKAQLIADLDVPHLLQLVNEFTITPLALPEGLELTGNLSLTATAELDMPAFTAGSTQLGHYIPTLHRGELTLSIAKAAHAGVQLEQPSLTVKLRHLHQREDSLIPHGLEQAQLDFQADSITLPSREGEEETTLRKAALSLHLQDVSLEMEEGGVSPCIGSASGSLHLDTISLPDFSAEGVNMELAKLTDLRPVADDWRELLQQGTLRLSAESMFSGNTLLGAFSAAMQVDAAGHIDLTSTLDRDGHRLHLDLHPQLTEEGLLTLDLLQLELPAAGFAPLLELADLHITQIRIPDTLFLSGSILYDTRGHYLRKADITLSIPHLVRTPGNGVAAFAGKEIPLSVQARATATGREDGNAALQGELTVLHKVDSGDRELKLRFRGDTADHLHLEGTNTIDVGIVDQLIDLQSAHTIMRDFSTHAASRTDVDIPSVDINWATGLTVTASCDARIVDIGYQMNAFETEKDASGNPTGREKLRQDFGKDPFSKVEKATAHVDVLYKENAAGKVEATRISILNADITYDNRPWLQRQGFRSGARHSRLQGDAIIIDVEESFVELKNVRGNAYPAYAIGAYYDDLPGFMEDIIFRQPARIETQHCLFPIYSDCKRSMSGCIRILADTAGFRFLGTTFPLTSLSGFIWFRDGAVCLDRLNAACWDGAINAAVNIDYSGKHTGFDGYASLCNINLQPLAAAYDSKQQPALCNGRIRFRTRSPEVNDLKAYGNISIENGDLMSLSIFRPVGDLISDLPGNLAALENKVHSSEDGKPKWIDRQLTKVFETTGDAVSNVGSQVGWVTNNIPFANHFLRYDLQEVHGNFTIGRGKLVTQDMSAVGYNLDVGMQLTIDLNKLTLDGDIWPKISSVPTLLLSPITFLSDFMIDIHVNGPLDGIKWKLGLNKKAKGQQECSVSDKKPDQPRKSGKP